MASIIHVGLDVHTKSFSLCAYNRETGEVNMEAVTEPTAKGVQFVLETLRKDLQGGSKKKIQFICGYEAGCMGYTLQRQIEKLGYQCVILAPTTMSRRADQSVKKNDKKDAYMIAECLANKLYKPVYIPTIEDESIKEYIRMRDDIKDELKRLKQRFLSYCNGHGKHYDKTVWTQTHIDWLKTQDFGTPVLNEVRDEFLSEYDRLKEKIDRFDKRIEEFAQEDRYREKVAKLRCFKGIDTHTAMAFLSEVGDFNRFETAGHFSAYVGLVPGEHTTSGKGPSVGITKTGNCHLRRLLIEGAQSFTRGSSVKSKRLKAKQAGNAENIIAYADRANSRFRRKWSKMAARSVKGNVIKTAIAREMACFIWGMMTENIA